MSESVLTIERRERVALLTMNRPEYLNALNRELQDSIMQTCQELRDDDDIWAVVLTGAGRGFSSGADLRGGDGSSDEQPGRQERLDVYSWMGRLATAIYRTLDKPIIAAVNGVAAGAGMSVALACDIRIGTEKTRFKVVFIERSLSPDTGMSFFLPRIVGYSRACDLIYSSRFVEADEAYRIGLLDRLVPADRLLDEALELANQIAFWPPVAMQSTRRVLQQSMESTLEEQLQNESFGLNFARRAPHDLQESQDSFLERRPPRFTGQ
ncbi:MAG TPA: enoyl-CoA hydratase/isomerase family protein [Dehalococcoidales bacterium]|nr:enoyl-CoA hydratase/isomerase family protein [Dehalococcoidales bacterium]